MATGGGEEATLMKLPDEDIMGQKAAEPTLDTASPRISESDFTKIVGLVEDIFVGEDFQTMHSDYFTKHCSKFSETTSAEDSSELEKLTKEKFQIFRTYSVETAAFLERELKRSLGDPFEIDQFIQEVERRTQQVQSTLAQEKAASGGESSGPNSPRSLGATAVDLHRQNQQSDITEIMGGEIFEMLLTLKDYARFQELMVDYLEMVQGNTPNMEGLVSLRHLSDEEDGDDN